MAKLLHQSGRDEVLAGEHSIGRSSACLLQLDDRRASAHHALLRWVGNAWEIADLGSRNGTWIDGHRLDAGRRQLVRSGSKLSFGSNAADWQLADDAPPTLLVQSPNGARRTAIDGLLVLRGPDDEQLLCYADEDGRWVIEDAASERLLQHNELLQACETTWKVLLPELAQHTTTATSTTLAAFDLDSLVFRFEVSLDEENIELTLTSGDRTVRLPHRAHHYLLLTLARARVEDAALEPSERGWRYQDDLARGLRIPLDQFNVRIFRARQHLLRAGVDGAKGIIERRRGSGQLRFGVADVNIDTPS